MTANKNLLISTAFSRGSVSEGCFNVNVDGRHYLQLFFDGIGNLTGFKVPGLPHTTIASRVVWSDVNEVQDPAMSNADVNEVLRANGNVLDLNVSTLTEVLRTLPEKSVTQTWTPRAKVGMDSFFVSPILQEDLISLIDYSEESVREAEHRLGVTEDELMKATIKMTSEGKVAVEGGSVAHDVAGTESAYLIFSGLASSEKGVLISRVYENSGKMPFADIAHSIISLQEQGYLDITSEDGFTIAPAPELPRVDEVTSEEDVSHVGNEPTNETDEEDSVEEVSTVVETEESVESGIIDELNMIIDKVHNRINELKTLEHEADEKRKAIEVEITQLREKQIDVDRTRSVYRKERSELTNRLRTLTSL